MLEIVSTSQTENGTLYMFSDGTLVRLDIMRRPIGEINQKYQRLIEEYK